MTTLRFPILRPFERGRYGFDNPRSPGGHLWAETTRFRQSYRMSGLGRFLPVANLSPDRQLLGESRHSSKEFICSVRSSLNDCFRLEAALQLTTKKSRRQAATGQKQTFVTPTIRF